MKQRLLSWISSNAEYLRRYGMVVYWLFFAILTIHSANYPGFVFHPEEVPYPWTGIFIVWIILAIETLGLYKILEQKKTAPIGRRISRTLLYSAALAVVFVIMPTDMPGITYVPGYFAILTLIFLSLWGLIFGFIWTWQKLKRNVSAE